MIRLIYFIPMWILYISIWLPLVLLGWILIPFATICRAYNITDLNVDKPYDGPILHFTWRFMWLWDNDGDGIANQNYKQFDSDFKQIIYWSCIRNPVNNLRFVPFISVKIQPLYIKWIGTYKTPKSYDDKKMSYWLLCWQGPYSCFRKQYLKGDVMREFWIGWKIWPSDINGVSAYRSKSAGFAMQWKDL